MAASILFCLRGLVDSTFQLFDYFAALSALWYRPRHTLTKQHCCSLRLFVIDGDVYMTDSAEKELY